jgi:hypothetical protein
MGVIILKMQFCIFTGGVGACLLVERGVGRKGFWIPKVLCIGTPRRLVAKTCYYVILASARGCQAAASGSVVVALTLLTARYAIVMVGDAYVHAADFGALIDAADS